MMPTGCIFRHIKYICINNIHVSTHLHHRWSIRLAVLALDYCLNYAALMLHHCRLHLIHSIRPALTDLYRSAMVQNGAAEKMSCQKRLAHRIEGMVPMVVRRHDFSVPNGQQRLHTIEVPVAIQHSGNSVNLDAREPFWLLLRNFYGRLCDRYCQNQWNCFSFTIESMF